VAQATEVLPTPPLPVKNRNRDQTHAPPRPDHRRVRTRRVHRGAVRRAVMNTAMQGQTTDEAPTKRLTQNDLR